MNGGDVIFKFKGDTKDVEKKTDKLNSKVKSIASKGGKALLGYASVMGTALVGVTTKAVQAQGELEQQIGGTEAVFKQFAKTVQTDAAGAFDKMGVSANDYMAYMNKMGSLMQGSGLDTKKAMDLSSKAMQRAADVASIMGIDTDAAFQAIAGAAKGNFTMMDNLGVAMNATSLNAYALQKGLKKTYAEMSQGEKVELAMQMFLEKSAYAAGNYAKENKTYAGSLNTLKAAAQNFITGTGSLDQLLSAIQNFGQILMTQLQTILPQVVQGIVGLINGLLPMLPTLIQAILPGLIQGIVDLTTGIIQVLPDIITMIADMLPTLIPQIVDAILTIIPVLIDNIPLFISAAMKLANGIVLGLIKSTPKILSAVVKIMKSIWTSFKELPGKMLDVGIDCIKGLWNGINDVTDWILTKIKGFKDKVMSGIKKFFGISSPSKEFEIIGKFNIMGLEKGMEKESLKLQDTFDTMFDLSPNLYGNSSLNLSPTVNVTNIINQKQDPLGQMVNDVKTFSGGAKNDYSYGMGA